MVSLGWKCSYNHFTRAGLFPDDESEYARQRECKKATVKTFSCTIDAWISYIKSCLFGASLVLAWS